MPDHHFSLCRHDIWSRIVIVDVSAVIVRQRIFQFPGCPVLDVDDAPHAVLLHRVVPQLVQRRPVQRVPVVD